MKIKHPFALGMEVIEDITDLGEQQIHIDSEASGQGGRVGCKQNNKRMGEWPKDLTF